GVVGGIAGRNQTLALGQYLCLIDELPLFQSADGNLAFAAALGPGILEYESISAICPLRDELDRFSPAQAECGLQAQRDADAMGVDLLELVHGELLGFGQVAGVHPIRNAVGGIAAGD